MQDVFIQGSKPSFDENCEKIEHYILHVYVLYMHVVALLNKTPVLNINIMRVKMSSDSTLNFYENYLNQFFQICCFKR